MPGSVVRLSTLVTFTCGLRLFVTTHVTGAVTFVSDLGPV